MKKFILSCACILLAISGYAETIEVDGLCYNISENSTEAEVTRTSFYSGDIVIPESFSYEGKKYTVTSIGRNAFNYCTEMTSLIIPNTIKEIGDGAISGCI